MRFSAHLFICALAVAPAVAFAQTPAQLFDKPSAEKVLPLKPAPLNPQTKPNVSCFYYPGFMVKQIDMGEKGAAQLSIVPVTGTANPDCGEANTSAEKVIDSNDWSGYFRGVKGNHIFFDADDGVNGGVGFAIFNPGGKKLFKDVAADLHTLEVTPKGLALSYRRVYSAPCSLVADAAGCWEKVKAETGLAASPADCAAAYEAERKAYGNSAEQMAADPSVVEYDVETTLEDGQAKIKPVVGKVVCRPAN